jgi:hypothetical protein
MPLTHHHVNVDVHVFSGIVIVMSIFCHCHCHQSLATVVAGVAFAAHGGCILCGRRGIWCMSRGKSISASSSIIVIASISWFLFLLLNFLLLTSPF